MKVLDSISQVVRQKNSATWSIHPDATVYDALKTMAEREIGALPVIQEGKLLGLISERDYARKVILVGRSSKETKVSDIMTRPPMTVTPECSVDEAMRTMTEQRVRHLPVVGPEGNLVDIVSIGDLVKWIISSHEKTIEQLESYISGSA
ncbi:MAG TPA: CBS domain-containing protein [Bryobacteraceae bacterium]|jgi:CBS domain-containing protein|nr:CBS domain-containing protein [Bryobacteraceae bacterium]